MVLEEDIPAFASWIGPALASYLFIVFVVAVTLASVAWLVLSVIHGPLAAGDRVYRGALTLTGDLLQLSPRRTWALARLAIQESIRRNVLAVLAFFAVVLLFAGWFLDPSSVNPGRLYVGFILNATSLLVSLLAVALAAISLPADIKAKAIQTVTTKPVRTVEIVAGRIIGFSLVGTGMIMAMGLAGWAFIVRSVDHSHTITAESLLETRSEDGAVIGYEGRTSLSRGHRHRIELDRDDNGWTEFEQGHRHPVSSRTAADGTREFVIGGPDGLLEARRPLRGTLRFLAREGRPSDRGISVGAEWAYRQYIEGGTLAAAIWTFEGVTAERFPDGLPLEMLVRVFRTYKGEIEQGIQGSIRLRNPQSGLQSDPFYFTAKEFTIDSLQVPSEVSTTTVDGGTRKAKLFGEIVSDGRVEVVLQCLAPAQYYGVAQADFYLRAGEGSFGINYLKSCLGIWFTMLIVTATAVVFSTFLSAPVAILATAAVLVIGWFRDFVERLFESQVTGDFKILPGGGPIESLYRIVTQTSITLELDPTPAVTAMKAADTFLLSPIRALVAVFPSIGRLGTGDFVASGFDIPFDLIAENGLATLGYVLPCIVLGALVLRTREVAS
ncbi:MAG: hypothetical protein ACKOCN_02085 [Planctomycetaceae bacterium]